MKNTTKAKFKEAALEAQTSSIVMGDQLQYMMDGKGNLSTAEISKLERSIYHAERAIVSLKAAISFIQQAKLNNPQKVTHLEVFLYSGKKDPKVINDKNIAWLRKEDHPSWPPTESELRYLIKNKYPKTKTFSAFFNNGNKLCEDAVVF